MMFYLTPGISPGANVLRDVISAAGGSVLKTRPPSHKIQEFQQVNLTSNELINAIVTEGRLFVVEKYQYCHCYL